MKGNCYSVPEQHPVVPVQHPVVPEPVEGPQSKGHNLYIPPFIIYNYMTKKNRRNHEKSSVQKLYNYYTFVRGGLAALTSFASCDNFLNASQVKKEIEDAIAYNNAKEITVLIQSQVNTGSTLPSGNHIAKQGYEFEISFSEAQGYSFEKWIAVSKENPDQTITDGVIFTDAASPKTKVKITNDKIPLQIIPQCTSRIAVSGEPSPQYNQNGVGWNRSIYVEFTKELSPASFIFAASELPQAAEPVYDSNNQIYAYTLEGQTYFKNLSITTADGLSVARHFQAPAIDGKYLTIEANKLNRIPFATGETSKTIIVTLKNGISDITGVSMSAEKTWRYVIVDASDEKASINFTAGTGEGLLNAVSGSYSVGQTIDLLFTPNSDYQFIKWDYDSSILKIKDPANPDTTITVIEKTSGTQSSQVKAVCAPRPRIVENGFSPVTGGTTASVSKNTPIQITFTQNLPDDEAGRAQMENINITIAGNPVKSSFLAPSITGGTVTFNADPLNMLDVPVNQTKTVTVSIPADFYYELEDEAHTKVYYGGNGKSFNYKINETTNEKAIITFGTSNTGSGTITKGPRQGDSYSLGERIDLSFDLDENFQFNGWKIYDSDDKEILPTANGTAPVTIDKPSDLTTKLNINAEVQGIKVVADASMKLFVTETSPQGLNIARDSDITITFSKPLDNLCTTSDFLNQIKIKLDGINVDSFFTYRTASGNKITIKNTKLLNVAENERKTVSVSVPSSFYYVDRNITINLGKEYTFVYEVTSQTNVTLPSVTSRSPASSQSVTTSTPIVITFNMEMDTVSPASELFTWDNIRLTYLGQSLDEHFETPVYDSATKTLTLMPVLIDQSTDNLTSLASYIKNVLHLNSIDLQVSLQNIMVGNLPLKADSNSTFTVRYMGQNENTPPEQSEFFVTRDQISLAEHNHTNEFTYASFADFDNDTIHQNATNGTIYIYGTYQDTDTGVKAVVVTEKHTNDTNGAELIKNACPPVEYTARNSSDYFTTDSSGFTTFCIPHQIQCDDGAIYITVDVQDACQNHAPIHAFTAIKKSSISLDNVQLTNLRVSRDFWPLTRELNEDINYYYDNIKNVKIERIIAQVTDSTYSTIKYTQNFYNSIYGTTMFNGNDYTFTCEYENNEGEFVFNDSEDINNQYWSCNLDVDSVAGKSVTVYVEDFLGNRTQRTYTFPELCIIKTEVIDTYRKIWFKKNYKDKFLSVKERDGEYDFGSTVGFYTTIFSNETCQFMFQNESGLWSDLSRVLTLNDIDNYAFISDSVELSEQPIISKSDIKGCVDITLNIDKTVWKSNDNLSGFDDILIFVDNSSYGFQKYLEKGIEKNVLNVSLESVASRDTKIEVYGIKNGVMSKNPTKYTIPRITDKSTLDSFDNQPPGITLEIEYGNKSVGLDDKCCCITFYDNRRVDYNSLVINGVPYLSNQLVDVNGNKAVCFPIWDILNKTISISVSDIAGNSVTNKITVEMEAANKNVRITKNESSWHVSPIDNTNPFYYRFQEFDTQNLKWNYNFYLCYLNGESKDYTPPENTFVKLNQYTEKSKISTIPRYYYTGTEQNSGTYDLVLPNGNSKSSVVIQSDAPVFVQTLVTNVSYNECKDWPTDKWDFYKKPVDERILSFSADTTTTDENGTVTTLGNHSPKRYTIPMDQIEDGQCYCVVAHFADGTTAQSQVWQK